MKFRLFSGVFPDPVWKFFGSDVPTLAMVGAALRDQDLITILDRIQSPRAVDGLGEISFISRKQDRKRGQAVSFGVMRSTRGKTWLSVMTRDGFFFKESSAAASSDSRQTIGMAPESRRSRITCCCGRIRRPFGAALSIGTTR